MYPDGRFSVKGRATDSVRFKINMFLIWPSIIESAISTLPGVRSIKVHYLSTLKGLNVCEFIMCVYWIFCSPALKPVHPSTKAYLISWANPWTYVPCGAEFFLDMTVFGLELCLVRDCNFVVGDSFKKMSRLMKMLHKLDKSQKKLQNIFCYPLSFYERIISNILGCSLTKLISKAHNSWNINTSELQFHSANKSVTICDGRDFLVTLRWPDESSLALLSVMLAMLT